MAISETKVTVPGADKAYKSANTLLIQKGSELIMIIGTVAADAPQSIQNSLDQILKSISLASNSTP